MADVANALPALLRAQKIQKRAARAGFDWPDVEGAFAKLDEETGEVRDATTEAETHEEIGDLLFAAVNISRHLGVDAEAALKDATAKFERRFRSMEAIAGDDFEKLDLEAKEALWQRAKVETAS
jgi:nucleoside triphosphate diphosphatase